MIMGEMEQETEKRVVAFLGPKASYTHQATILRFPPSDYTITPLTTIEDVFSAVQSGTASHGIVPFENSSNGSVVFTLDLFADAANRYAGIVVAGEIYLPVHHCLVGRTSPATAKTGKSALHDLLSRQHLKDDADSAASGLLSGQVTPTQSQPRPPPPRTKPLHDIAHVKKLYSHPQAWGQCKAFLNAYLKHAERQDVSSTSKAAEMIAACPPAESEKGCAAAAISSRLAAELNGLDVLAEGIEDSEGNSTRFSILQRQQHPATASQPAQLAEEDEMARYKTLISFSVPPDASAGALADSLAVFKRHNLNLTSINTRPSGLGAWHYIFFIEVMGRKRRDGEGGAVNLALLELERLVSRWRWLGSWERAEVGC